MAKEPGSKRGLYIGLGIGGCLLLLGLVGAVGAAGLISALLLKDTESPFAPQSMILTVEDLQVPRSCHVDISEDPSARLTWDSKTGEAFATFGNHEFSGLVTGDTVSLVATTEFDWSDGCRWKTEQRITGLLHGPPLAFFYQEAPLPGQRNCSNPCTATGIVSAVSAN
ncbi:MAG: hypothetical protein VX498_02940 [Myxococcota bacterium]|nr:hypothetical protein [Myxococcota bacterium]